MLDKYRHTGRNLYRNVIITLLFGSIAIVFVFWGMKPSSMGMAESNGAVAEVNGQFISLVDFQNEVGRLTDMYSQYLGNQQPTDAQRRQIEREALQSLVQRELVYQASAKQGITVSDEEVRDQILSIPYLNKDGRFQREYYEAWVANMRTTPAQFEQKVRKVLATQKVSRLFEQAYAPSDIATARDKELQQTRLNVQFAKISVTEVAKKIAVADSQVGDAVKDPAVIQKAEAYFRQHPDKFLRDGKMAEFSAVQPEAVKAVLREEAVDKKLKDLDAALKAGDAKSVDSLVSALGGKWEETGELSLATPQIPKLPANNDSVLRAVYGLKQPGDVAKQILREADAAYVLKLKSLTVKAAEKDGTDYFATLMASQKSQEALNLWIEAQRERASVLDHLSAMGADGSAAGQ
jgi:peptidyl-prolyl cis-trans isomerase D